MHIALTEEDRALRESVARFVEKAYAPAARRKLVDGGGFSEANWKSFADLGLLGLIVPTELGGMGMGAAETNIVMEQLGRGLVVEPFLHTAILGAGLVNDLGSEAQRRSLLPGIVEGRVRIALAALERGARFDMKRVETRAVPNANGFALTGAKAVVLGGDAATHLVVSGLVEGQGVGLFIVERGAAGLTLRGFPNIDGTRSAEATLARVQVDRDAMLGTLGSSMAGLDRAVDRASAALCAEAVGAMDRLLEITVDYLKTRQQFGQAIGKFQALQHRAADMFVAIEQARSISLCAAAAVDQPDEAERVRAVAAAKAIVCRSGRFVGQHAIQLHGGMGMTDELMVGHYAKRLLAIEMTWGDRQHQLERFVESG